MAVNAELDVSHRKKTAEMMGGFWREFALLVLVFVPLEFFLQVHEGYRWRVMIVAVLVSGILLFGSIMMEIRRSN